MSAQLVLPAAAWAELGRVLKGVALPQWHALLIALSKVESALGLQPRQTVHEARLILAGEITPEVRIAEHLGITNADMMAAPDRVALLIERLAANTERSAE